MQVEAREAQANLMLARYHSSSLGRFMAVDPSRASISRANPQSWNRYSYSLNNPINFLDPDGRIVEPAHADRPYTVTGNSLSKVAPQIKRFSGFASQTSGDLKVKNVRSGGTVAKQADGSYSATLQVKSATVAVTTTTESPVWSDSSKASSSAQAEWGRFSGAVDTHEAGHVGIMRHAAGQLDAALPGLSATATGATADAAKAAANGALGAKVQEATDAAVASADARKEEYETSTGHGATQGAILDVSKDKKK